MDSQTVWASVNAPKETTGLDPGKRSPGRKRGIATDVLGLVIAAVVVAASVHDNAIGITLLDKVAALAPTVTKAWVDAGFKNAVVEHGARLGFDVEIVQREPGAKGFAPEPKRWVVEQTLGTLMLHRRLARDDEARPVSSLAMIPLVHDRRHALSPHPHLIAAWRDPPAGHGSPPTSGSVDEGTPGKDRDPAAARPRDGQTAA
ncbi:transposase [Streptomyces inhibens]|uniref:transposase n=1 Tax=Streptomyces inhibens TaxID=2293571 RepID=UPI00402A60BD